MLPPESTCIASLRGKLAQELGATRLYQHEKIHAVKTIQHTVAVRLIQTIMTSHLVSGFWVPLGKGHPLDLRAGSVPSERWSSQTAGLGEVAPGYLLQCLPALWRSLSRASVLQDHPILGPLVRNSRLFLGLSLSVLIGDSGLPSSRSQSGIYEAKRKLRKLTAMSFLGPQGP